jgi:hypothetical protein
MQRLTQTSENLKAYLMRPTVGGLDIPDAIYKPWIDALRAAQQELSDSMEI